MTESQQLILLSPHTVYTKDHLLLNLLICVHYKTLLLRSAMQGFKHGRVFDSKMKAIFLGAFYHINNIAVTVRIDNFLKWMWEVTKNDTCT